MSAKQKTTKERPILFSGEMVRALLAGRKTQTRRKCIVRTQYQADILGSALEMDLMGADDGSCEGAAWNSFPCPYGQPGDRLWVREPYLIAHVDHLLSIPKTRPDWMDSIGKYLLYGADGDCCRQIPECQCASVGKLPWRPSIHMPRWASRLTLEITGVRAERLQDISEADAIAEGVNQRASEPCEGRVVYEDYDVGNRSDPGEAEWFQTARQSYRSLWESIHGPRSWERNDWVWVVEFKIVEGGASA